MKLFVALLLVCILGVGALYAQTDGFTVVTTEAARRDSVARHPRALPDAALTFASGRRDGLLDALHTDGRVTIVNFIYTRCVSLCLVMGSEFQQMQAAIAQHGLEHRVRLLSISFDPADTPDELAVYARSQHADPQVWQFARVADSLGRSALLAAFGIVVVPAPLGQYVHNAAYHIVAPDGRLTRIVDYNEPQSVLPLAQAQARTEAPAATAARRP